MAHYIVAGSTGLIGQALAHQLNDSTQSVTLITRRNIPTPHPHQTLLKTDFNPLTLPPAQSTDDAIFCALGTTIKKAGSKQAFEDVDYGLVVQLANAAKTAGYERFIVVSSTGTKPSTKNFYLQTKAKMEAALQNMDFEQLVILRPSLLLGVREEFRFGERVGEAMSAVLRPLFVGKLKRYQPVHAEQVAGRMISAALEEPVGSVIIESEQI